MTHISTAKFFTKQLAYIAGYSSPKRFTTDVLRYDLPIHPCGPESFRDNLYDLPGLLKAAVLRQLREIGLPVSRIKALMALLDDEAANEASTRFISGQIQSLHCVVLLGNQPTAEWADDGPASVSGCCKALLIDVTPDLRALLNRR
jgi:hypothetical protein